MHIPKFKDHLHPIIIDEEKVILYSELGQQLLTGKSLVHVTKHLNGKASIDEIVQSLDGIVEKAQVLYVISYLESKKYVTEATNELPETEAAFWALFGLDESQVIKQKEHSKIKIYPFGTADTKYLLAALKKVSAIGIVECDENFAVIFTDDYLQDGVKEVAKELWFNNTPFIICKPYGLEMWLGPVFSQDHTACFECLRQRLIANRDVEVYLKEMGLINSPLVSKGSLNATVNAGINLLVTQIARFMMLGFDEKNKNTLISFNYETIESQRHTVIKRPQCLICGDEKFNNPKRLPHKIAIQASPKNFIDGGHRSVTATETFEKFKHHISPISGIVNKLEKISAADNTLQPVFISGQNMALKTNDFQSLKKNLRSNSCGKGVTEIQAKVSAIGEAIERYSGVYRGEEIKIISSYNALADQAIHPNDCMHFSAQQYQNRNYWNAKKSFFNIVPLKFDKNAEIEWSPLWSVTRNGFVYLPTALCYYSHPKNKGAHFFCAPDSNGSAAGNSLEEAMLQGFMELIERDSVAIWWYNRLKRPAVDLASFNDPYANELINYHKGRNRDLWVLDLTSDTGIPAFIAISARNDRSEYQDIVFAPAAHIDPEIALRRALTELNQMMPSMNDSLPKGSYNYDDPECVTWWQTCNVDNQPYLLPDQALAPTSLASFKLPKFNDIKDDLDYCIEVVKKLGLELHILDQTRPDIGFHVVKVVVPGLRHFWARNAPGRLYDVPVKMGWLKQALKEEELNPISIFI